MAKHEPIVELFYNDTWHDITTDVYTRDPITITRGRGDESGQPAPTTATMTLKNTSGTYNPTNPSSPLYGLIRRNTPLRILMDTAATTLASEGFEDTPGAWGISIDDQGDGAWGRGTLRAHTGTASLQSGAISDDQHTDAVMTIPGGAMQLTFWYKVSSESGFDFFRFYVDDVFQFEASGEVDWTQHTVDVSAAKTVTFRYIKDTSVAEGDDAAYIDDVVITGTRIYFAGEVGEWIPRRALDGRDAWTGIVASGITRRLGQGADPLQSTVTRHAVLSKAVAYWPLTDHKDAQVAASGVNGEPLTFQPFDNAALTVLPGRPVFGGGTLSPYPWLPPVMATAAVASEFSGGLFGGTIIDQPTTTQWAYDVLYRATAGNSETSLPMDTEFYLYTNADFRWHWRPTTNFTAIEVAVYTKNNTSLGQWVFVDGSTVSAPGLFDGNTHHVRLDVRQLSPTTVHWDLYLDAEVLSNDDVVIGRLPGAPSYAEIAWFSDPISEHVDPVHIGSFTVYSAVVGPIPDTSDSFTALLGHRTEHAARRIQRLCREESIPFIAIGDRYDTARLGGQYPDGLVSILHEAADTDMGILTDTVDQLGLTYRTRTSLYNQNPALELDFAGAQLSAPLDPRIDDQAVRNDITTTRRDGGQYRAVLDSGPLSVQSPPHGIGRYTTSVTRNVAYDLLLRDHAGWQLHLGTTGDVRFPQVVMDLDAAPQLAATVEKMRIGDLITIANLPPDFSPDLARLIVQGWTETLASHRRVITLTCTPASPWTVGIYAEPGSTPDPAAPMRYSPQDSTTTADFRAGIDTALTVQDNTGDLDLWAGTGSTSFDINVAGVRLRVTAVIGASSPQTLTVQQSPINGVMKTIPAGTAVHLWTPARYALGDRLMPKAGDIITARSVSEAGISAGSIGSFSTTSTTYVDAGNPTSLGAFAFTKQYDAVDSRLKVTLHVGSRTETVPATVDWAVRINGVDYQVLHYEHNTASAHETASGFRFITGIPDGAYTVQLRFKSPTGISVVSDANDFFSCNIEEIPV